MGEDKKFTKLGDLVNNTFVVTRVWPYKYKMWDAQSRRMLVSDGWQKGYRKVWPVDTDKGSLDLGQNQMASLLEAVMDGGKADIDDQVFEVKSNGKSGLDIRYFFNVVKQPSQSNVEPDFDENEPLDMSEIPF